MYASPLLLLICDVIWGKIITHTLGELVSIMPVKGGGKEACFTVRPFPDDWAWWGGGGEAGSGSGQLLPSAFGGRLYRATVHLRPSATYLEQIGPGGTCATRPFTYNLK